MRVFLFALLFILDLSLAVLGLLAARGLMVKNNVTNSWGKDVYSEFNLVFL